MGLISTGVSAITKLGALAVLLAAFGVGLAGVVYMSLSGKEVTVPELVGKDFVESEKELASLGLRIRRRADRPSTEKINTVVEQLPKPGETVKSGQWISVVVSRAGVTPDEAPKSLIKNLDEDDSKKIEDMISDKPKKAKNSNSNSAKKKADTTRDTIANTATDSDTGDKSTPAGDTTDKKDKKDEGDKPKSGNPTAPPAKPQQSPAAKPSGEQRPRTTKP